ncbi:hypothetical protein P3W45_001540 [Vairimorpha bombi]
MHIKLFLDEVKKKIDNKHLVELFKEYLSKVNGQCGPLRYVIGKNQGLKKYEDVLLSCHKIFMTSQLMIDDLSCKDITPYKNRDMDIVMCYTFYSGVYIIYKSHLPDDLYRKVIEVYEDANLKLNVPRDDAEENKNFFAILRKYIGDVFIPLRMANLNVEIDEYEFAILYLVRVHNVTELPEYLMKKDKIKKADAKGIADDVYNLLKLESSKEILDLSLLKI